MKSTGIIRKIDELGRIVLPKELRDILGIHIKDGLKISLDGNRILLNRYEKDCAVCNTRVDLVEFKRKMLCKKCIELIKSPQK